ncbi:MAG: DUF3783 domain-containing protein [Peptostreptococcaceae bacterium]|nr:DUF3783 domain-containing protein [Peptostreptococcaceae bacterium]
MKKILLYGVDQENLMKIVPVLQDSGARVHLLKNEELHQELLEVLDSDECFEYEEPHYDMSLCLFGGYTKDEIYDVIGQLSGLGVKKPVFATVTQKNIHWKIGRLLVDVNQEHAEMQKLAREKKL